MATTYTLTINSMDCLPHVDGQTDVVIRVRWTYSGTDGTATGAVGGATDLTYQPKEPFTPYADLTQQQVIDWVYGSWTADERLAYEAMITEQMAVVTPPLPWSVS